MAFVPTSEEEQEVAPTPAATAPVATSGAGVSGTKPTAPAANTPGVNVPQAPSAALANYLSANQNQATTFGTGIANALGQQTSAAANAIAPAVNTYTGQLVNVPVDTAVNNTVSTAPSTLSAADQAAYTTELNAQANMPNSANTFETTAPYSTLTTDIQNAVEQANLWNSGNNAANLSTAVQPFEAPNATTGETTLDALLLSQTPGAYSQITNAVAPAANLQSQLTAGTTQADTALQNAITNDEAATAAANAAANTYATNLTTQLQNAVNTATAGDTAQNAQIMTDLTNNTPSASDLATLGITQAQWNTLASELATDNPSTFSFNTNLGEQTVAPVNTPFNLSSFLSQSTPVVTDAEVATPQQYADVAMLQQLLGTNTPTLPISSATASQANTAPTSTAQNTFNLADAELAAKVAPLQAEAQAVSNYGQYAENQYNNNGHFGGQTPSQMNTFLTDINGVITNLNNQITNLESSAQTSNGVGQVATPNSTSPVATALDTANVVFPLLPFATLGLSVLIPALSCFAASTPIDMEDGTTKAIEDIKVGDKVKGGSIELIICGRSSNIYSYDGIKVTGSHYVFEDGSWISVDKSKLGDKVDSIEIPVYDFVTTNHTISIKGINFSDAISMAWFDIAYMKNKGELATAYLQNLATKVPV